MGWTFYQRPYGLSKIETIRKEFNDLTIIYDMVYGNQWYAITENPKTNRKTVLVVLTSFKNGEFGFKTMSETCLPYYFNVNKKFLKLVNKLIPLSSYQEGIERENARLWRINVSRNLAVKKATNKTKIKHPLAFGTKLQYGTKIIELGQFITVALRGRKNPVKAYQIVGDHRVITQYQVSKGKII